MVDKKLLIGRMLESENLTDELQDADAQWLLDWGINRLDQVLQGVLREDEANERVTALMGVLRKINRMVGARSSKDPEALAADCMALAALFAQAFDFEPHINQDQYAAAATQLPQGTTHQALEFLSGWGLQAGGKS